MFSFFKRFFLDIIPVFTGVLIAMLVNNWKEEADNKKYIDKVLYAISLELEDNKVSMEEIMELQQLLIDSGAVHVPDERYSVLDIIRITDGFKGTQISNVTGVTLINARIELIDYELIAILSGIEEAKKLYNLKLEKIMDFAFQNLNATAPEKKELFLMMTSDLMDAEDSLLTLFNTFLDKWSEQGQESPKPKKVSDT